MDGGLPAGWPEGSTVVRVRISLLAAPHSAMLSVRLLPFHPSGGEAL